MALRDITAASVNSAIAEYDDLGQVAFLSKYGFRPARKFVLFYAGKTYDSKAIAGVAHQYATGEILPWKVFNGGAQTVRPLLALGFDVRDTSAQNIPDTAGPIGDVDVSVGAEFASRQEVREAGVHRALQAGIVGTGQTGAESIVVSGGYEDDEDAGSLIVYTGHGGQDGGRQVRDQTFEAPGNAALLTSKLTGAPVRVVRGAHRGSPHAPATGYRYDGLYRVEDAWRERGNSGHLICRYRMADFGSSTVNSGVAAGTGAEPAPAAVPAGTQTPGRTTTTAHRLVRSISVAEYVKSVHDHRCQTCGTVLDLGGRRYSEGAHIQGLGRPHNGPDTAQNMLCLCPNCHVLFDNGALLIDAETLMITLNGNEVGTLRTDERHVIEAERLRHHASVHR